MTFKLFMDIFKKIIKKQYDPEILICKSHFYNIFYLTFGVYEIELNFEQFRCLNCVVILYKIKRKIVQETIFELENFHHYLMYDTQPDEYSPQHIRLLIYLKKLYKESC